MCLVSRSVVVGARVGASLQLALHVTGVHGAVFVLQAVIVSGVAEFGASLAELFRFGWC